MDSKRRREARRNLQKLIEAYLLEETSMRWCRPGQIRAAAEKLMQSRTIPAPLAERIQERLNAIRLESSGTVGELASGS